MNSWQRNKLESSLVEISYDLDISETILKLQARNIFDIDDKQIILNDKLHKNNSEKRQKLIDILATRGEKSYWAFCHIVKDKCPEIFNLLHECMDDRDEDIQCTVCNGQDEADIKSCNICKGMYKTVCHNQR